MFNVYDSNTLDIAVPFFSVKRILNLCKIHVKQMRHGVLEERAERNKKNRGKYLFAKHLPRILLIFSIQRLLLHSGLSGSQSSYRNSEWRA